MPFEQLSNGERIYYEVKGEGPTVALIPPAVSDHSIYFQLGQALARGSATPKDTPGKTYKVILFDLPGMGESDASKEKPLSIKSYADRLAQLMNLLGEKQAHVLGLSLGSAIAQEFAINYPQMTSSLFLACTWTKSDAWISRVALLHKTIVENFPFKDYLEMTLPYLASREFNNTPIKTGAFLSSVIQTPPSPAEVSAQWDAIIAHDTLDRLWKINCPTLVLTAENDYMLPPAYGQEVAENISKNRLVNFTGPHASHLLIAEMYREFIKCYLGFLNGLEV